MFETIFRSYAINFSDFYSQIISQRVEIISKLHSIQKFMAKLYRMKQENPEEDSSAIFSNVSSTRF